MNDSVIGSEAISVDDALQINFAFNYLHQRIFTNIGDNLGIDFTISFVDTEDDGFAERAAS